MSSRMSCFWIFWAMRDSSSNTHDEERAPVMADLKSFTIGVDVGGTFTDVTIIGADGRIAAHKTPSTPRAPADCVRFVHGSTIGLNTIIRRVGARVGLLVTGGFEDLLELGRTKMPEPFSMFTTRPAPLARKNWVRGIVERMD